MRILLMLAAVSIIALIDLDASPRSAAGHGAVLRLAAGAVAAGDSLAMTGEGLGSRDTIALVLEGAAGRFPLASVPGDSQGRFAATVLIPPEVPAGEYRVVATGGHDRAAASLLVSAQAPALSESPHNAMHARADDFTLRRRRAPLERGLVAGLLLALIAAGIALRRPGRTP